MLSFSEKAYCEYHLFQFQNTYQTLKNAELYQSGFIKEDKNRCEQYIYSGLFSNLFYRESNLAEMNQYINYC